MHASTDIFSYTNMPNIPNLTKQQIEVELNRPMDKTVGADDKAQITEKIQQTKTHVNNA